MKIILFGGAFNPVHNEHVNMAKAAIAALKADKLIVLPTAVSPHKGGRLTASGGDRLAMCRLAFADIECAEISDYELERGGISYTYITAEHFKRLYEGDELYFLVGADMLETFPDWKNPQDILKYVTLAACARVDDVRFDEAKREVEKKLSTEVVKIPYVGKEVSSTKIRTFAALGEDAPFINAAVGQYIKDNGLYFLPDIAQAKRFLTAERWKHSVNVAVMCAENARRVGLTEKQAITIGAIHDVAKYLPPDSPYLKGFTVDSDVPPTVVHQFSGAYMAVNYFKIDDIRLLDAIKYHTSGRENMGEAEKLLFLCDMLEESRSFDGIEGLRRLFNEDIDKCLFAALSRQLEYLKNSGKPVYNLTERAYNYLKDFRS